MTKATFDRLYKSVKGYMLQPVVVMDKDNITHRILDVRYDRDRSAIVIITE